MGDLELTEEKLKDLYGTKPTYFKRPLWSNTPYQYEIASFVNPHDFHFKIKDEFSEDYVKKLQILLEAYRKAWDVASLLRGTIFTERTIYVGMPVIYTNGPSDCPSTILRGEIRKFYKTSERVTLDFIDIGESYTTDVFNVFPITLDILRIPRMAIPCSLAYVYPKSGMWPDDVDVGYVKQFSGDSQIVYFHDIHRSTGSFKVSVEVNHVNITMQYFHDAFADVEPANLPVVETREKDSDPPNFPINDFTPWIGFKTIVFGVKVFNDGQQLKCVLQMDPHMVNSILDKIAEYVANAPEEVKKPPPVIAPGVCCIAKWNKDYFRVRILSPARDGKVLVEFVDYKETDEVKISDLLKMPDEILNYPEGAKVCVISDFMNEPCQDVARLTELVKDQNLYATIHECDPDDPNADLKVFLFRQTELYVGKDESFTNIFDVQKTALLAKRLLQGGTLPTQAQAEAFLKQDIEVGEKYTLYPQTNFFWVRLEDERKFARITSELTEFYKKFTANPNGDAIAVGSFVAATQLDDQNNWYRAKVLEKREDRVKLLYIDLFKADWIETVHVSPFNRYFSKDSQMTFQIILKEGIWT